MRRQSEQWMDLIDVNDSARASCEEASHSRKRERRATVTVMAARLPGQVSPKSTTRADARGYEKSEDVKNQ